MIAIAEVKAVMPQADPHWAGYGHAGGHADEGQHAHAAADKGGHHG